MARIALLSTLLLVVSAHAFLTPTVPPRPTVMSLTPAVRLIKQRRPTVLSDTRIEIQDQAVTSDEPAGKDETETQKLMRQVKDAGTAGVISYALWELAFWFVSVPVVLFGYYEVVGRWPDLSNSEDLGKLGAEAFAFVNFARFAVPLRIGLALSTTPWIQNNVVDRFMKEGKTDVSPNASPNDGTVE